MPIFVRPFGALVAVAVLSLLTAATCTAPRPSITVAAAEKHRGAHVFGRLDSLNVQSFHDYHIGWITLVPYASQRDIDNSPVRYQRGDTTAQRERMARWAEQIGVARRAGFKVFLKPHIWLHAPAPGKWRSDIYPADSNDWVQWAEGYRAFILNYAQIAADNQVEAFCVGTEFTRLSAEKPDFWRTLIRDVRAIYPGKLTYAANWYEEYEQVAFWDALDFIGVQAYFPLVTRDAPSVAQLTEGWQKFIPDLRRVHEHYQRPVLFTELGYKSTLDGATRPWEWMDYSDRDTTRRSDATQTNAYRAFFDTVWDLPWFAGVHLWQLRSDYDPASENYGTMDFTPLGKPSAAVIRENFAR